jgi:two-component system LytT family response regulator
MIKAIIVEDETEAANALSKLILNHCPEIRLVGAFNTVSDAIAAVSIHSPHLVFLDIELNEESGFDLLEKIASPDFDVVFTTAYSGYALRAIKYSCLDYLLKPIVIDELKTVIRKANRKQNLNDFHVQLRNLIQTLKNPNQEPKLCIPSSDGFVFLDKSEIVMCQAEGNYCIICTLAGEKIICSKNIGFIEELLDDHMFRCHKSYLINIDHVKKFEGGDNMRVLLKSDLQAEVSTRKKHEFLERLRVS